MSAPEINPDLLADTPEEGTDFGTITRGNHATHGDAFSGGHHHIDKSCVVRQNIYCGKAIEAGAFQVFTTNYGDSNDPQFDPEHVYTTNIVAGFVKNDADGNFLFGQAGGGTGATALDNLTDVTLTFPAAREYLCFNSGSSMWVNQVIAFNDLGDVVLTAPSDGQHLIFDGTSSTWINKDANGLDDLDDVTLTSPANGDFLRFDGSDWVNNGTLTDADVPDVLTLSTIIDGNGDESLCFLSSANPVNYFCTKNSDTGDPVELSSAGDDADVAINVHPKGDGQLNLFLNGENNLISQNPGFSATGAAFYVHDSGGADLKTLQFNENPGTQETFLTFSPQTNQYVIKANSTTSTCRIVFMTNSTGRGFHFREGGTGPGVTGFVKHETTGKLLFGQTIELSDLPPIALNDLSDTLVGVSALGQFLRYDGTAWKNQAILAADLPPHTHVEADITDLQAYLLNINSQNLSDLADVSAAAPNSGDHLEWNGSAWAPAAPGHTAPGAASLNDLSDVTLTSPSTGDFLRKSAGDWVNTTISDGDVPNTLRLDSLLDSNGNVWLDVQVVSGAVNHLRIGGNSSGGDAFMRAVGSDTDVGITFITQNSGVYTFRNGPPGSPTNVADGLIKMVSGVMTFNSSLVDADIPNVLTLTEITSLGSIKDTNGNIWLDNQVVASAVNHIRIGNNATGGDAFLRAVGSDVNVGLTFIAQGTGAFTFEDSAAAQFAVISSSGIEVQSDDAYYLGDKDTDGTWRFVRNGTDLRVELRESGTYNSKGSFTP